MSVLTEYDRYQGNEFKERICISYIDVIITVKKVSQYYIGLIFNNIGPM